MSLPTFSRAFGELFGNAKNKLNHIQKDMAAKIFPSMPGQPVGKFYDLAIGIDIHMPATVPPWPVCPVPHIGMVFDLMAVIVNAIAGQLPDPTPPAEDGTPPPFSLVDAACGLIKGMAPSVKVHGRWIANAGIPIVHLPGFILHFPFPIVAPMSESEMFMGSSIVLADGSPCSTQFHPALSCNTIGFPKPPRKPGLFKPSGKALQAPTSLLCIITSTGNPVLVGGPPTIDLFQLIIKIGIKCLGKMWSKTKLAQNLDDWFKKTKLGKIQQKVKCFLFGEPVDAATGRVFHENIDFELPGPIPLQWGRTYYSDAEVDGSLGYNWHHSYNISVCDMDDHLILRLSEGREVALPVLDLGETHYHRKEKLIWGRDKDGYYFEGASKLIHRFGTIKNRAGYCVLAKIMTKDGFEIRFQYNSKGDLLQITDSRHSRLLVDTDAQGRVTCISMMENNQEIRLVRYKYDEAGNMVETLDANDVSKHFHYKGHLLVKLTNQSGMSFYWEYEGEADLARCIHTWGDGGIQEYRTEYGDGFTRSRNSLGDETTYYYDENHLIYKIVDAKGGVTHQKYNQEGELEVVVDPEGYTTTRKYDDYGNVIQFINENDDSIYYEYDDNRNLIYVRTSGGKMLSWKYDEYGRIKQKEIGTGEKLTYQYKGPLLNAITDDEGKRYEFDYNKQNDLEKLTFSNGLHKQWEYDERGRVVQVRDINGNLTHLSYDRVDNVIEMKQPDGNIHHFEYDPSRNLIQAKDQLHNIGFTYGPMGAMKSRTQNGRTVRFGYDRELQLRNIINEGDERYEFELDALGHVVTETGFDGLQRRYIRDGLGRVSRVIRPGNRWTNYLYDGTGNAVYEQQYDESETSFRYNSDGQLIEALNEEGLIQFKRDRNGRIIKEVQGEQSIERKYNKHSECLQITSSLGADIRQQYDEEGNLSSVEAGQLWKADWQRDHTGLEIHRQLTGGVTIRTDRDRFGREVRKSVGVKNVEASNKQYNWGVGNRLQSIYDERNSTTVNFEYDTFDNLIRADYDEFGKQVETIYRAPDAIGNLYEDKNRKDRRYDKGGRLVEDPNYFYHYDCEGNLLFKEFKKQMGYSSLGWEALEKKYGIKFKSTGTGWLYVWSANGMLHKVVNPQQGKVRFGYDALGRRTYKEVKNRRTCWLWNGNVPLHEWTALKEDPRIDIITWVFEEGSFVPVARITDDQSYSIVTDYLGTPTQMYDCEGKKTWEAQLDIYGRVRTFDGRSLKDCPFRYQGQYQDEETGLYYNRFRYYDPELGSYISKDPIGLTGGNPTLYGYVSDPNRWLDILGLAIIPSKTYGNSGELLSGTATVTRADLGTGTGTNTSSRAWARKNGLPTDDAGHIIGCQLGGSGGKRNIFPQDFHVNRGAFAQFEGKVADFVDLHGNAKITVDFEYDINVSTTRPTAVVYTAEASTGDKISKRFPNTH